MLCATDFSICQRSKNLYQRDVFYIEPDELRSGPDVLNSKALLSENGHLQRGSEECASALAVRAIDLEQTFSLRHLDLQLKDRVFDQLDGVGEGNENNCDSKELIEVLARAGILDGSNSYLLNLFARSSHHARDPATEGFSEQEEDDSVEDHREWHREFVLMLLVLVIDHAVVASLTFLAVGELIVARNRCSVE